MPWIEQLYQQALADPGSRRYVNKSEFFADYLRKFRKDYGLTQTQLANAIDTSNVTIAYWENPLKDTLPNEYNQTKLRSFQRKLFVEQEWKEDFVGIENPIVIGLRQLLMQLQDETAKDSADYLVAKLADHLPLIEQVHLVHSAGIVHEIADGLHSTKGKQYASQSYKLAEKLDLSDATALKLYISLKNASLGYQFEGLCTLDPQKQIDEAEKIKQELLSLYDKVHGMAQKQPVVYLWNAMEVICKYKLDMTEVLEKLIDAISLKEVVRRIYRDPALEYAKPKIQAISEQFKKRKSHETLH